MSMTCASSCQYSIVNVALSCVVSEIKRDIGRKYTQLYFFTSPEFIENRCLNQFNQSEQAVSV